MYSIVAVQMVTFPWMFYFILSFNFIEGVQIILDLFFFIIINYLKKIILNIVAGQMYVGYWLAAFPSIFNYILLFYFILLQNI